MGASAHATSFGSAIFNFVSNSQYYRKNARNETPGAEDKAIKPPLKERFFLFRLIIYDEQRVHSHNAPQ